MAASVVVGALHPRPACARDSPPAVKSSSDDVGLLRALMEREGRVFADQAGGTVRGKSGRKRIVLHDGDRVEFVDDNSGIEMGEDTFAEVIFNQEHVKVPNQHIILSDRLNRSPDEKWAIFSAFVSCVNFCYATGWLLGPSTRIQLSKENFGVDVAVAWRKDGKEVAVGSRGLYLVSLPDGKVTAFEQFTSPAYAPDGRLFVRGNEEKDDAVYEWLSDGKPRKVLAMAGRPPLMETGTDPGDPSPVTFARSGAMTARFMRNDDIRSRVVAADAIGKNLDGTSAPRPPSLDRAVTLIEEPTTAPAAAAAAALEEGERSPAFAHELAVAANTRGYRLYQDGKLDDAIPLFKAAVWLDVKYGMPRYNLARIYALRGSARESIEYLRLLRLMGKPQQERLKQARKDRAFEKIADSPEFQAIFR